VDMAKIGLKPKSIEAPRIRVRLSEKTPHTCIVCAQRAFLSYHD